MHPVRTSLRAARLRAGWTQVQLADRVGLSRQSLAAIESGAAVPSTEIALRLARALGMTVEALFRLDDDPATIEVVESAGLGMSLPGRVRIGTVSGRRLAYGVRTSDGTAADGVGEAADGGLVRVRLFAERPPAPSLVVAGCDPAFGLVRRWLEREHGLEVLWLRTGSRAALEALARGVVHVAGVHLRDPGSGLYNTPWIERLVPFPCTRVAFATWEQGLLLRPGNPLGVERLADLARPGVRFLNRETGSGSRLLAESALAEQGIEGSAIPGFLETAADGHETVARAVAAGAADAGVAIRAVGQALDLTVLPLAEEPYELVIPDHFLELPAVDALLRALRRSALQQQVESLSGYDVTHMGRPA